MALGFLPYLGVGRLCLALVFYFVCSSGGGKSPLIGIDLVSCVLLLFRVLCLWLLIRIGALDALDTLRYSPSIGALGTSLELSPVPLERLRGYP